VQVPPHERTEHRGDPGNRTRYVRSNVHRQFAMQKFRSQDLPCVRSVHEGDLQCSTVLEYIPLPELSSLQYAPPPFWSDAPLSPREQPPQARKSWTQPGSNVLPLTLARQWGRVVISSFPRPLKNAKANSGRYMPVPYRTHSSELEAYSYR